MEGIVMPGRRRVELLDLRHRFIESSIEKEGSSKGMDLYREEEYAKYKRE
ncbi:hypothetical protein WL1483_1784 [Aeromonas schubertii]|uniref:Uncharacterized protein n=1 Tax=Aeromonas schubertii TaxID=652 RepID=A0A0S2SHK6_9GAMM|nr:hypothetical protein WL1483_1784 [Aeromonas schubertii]